MATDSLYLSSIMFIDLEKWSSVALIAFIISMFNPIEYFKVIGYRANSGCKVIPLSSRSIIIPHGVSSNL